MSLHLVESSCQNEEIDFLNSHSLSCKHKHTEKIYAKMGGAHTLPESGAAAKPGLEQETNQKKD